MRHIAAFLLATVMAVAVPATSSCATFGDGVDSVKTGVDVAKMVVDAIDGFSHSYFAQHPDQAKQASVDLQVARTRAAVAAVLQATEGAKSLKDARVSDAFKAFEGAYASLLELSSSFGVRAAPPGTPTDRMNAAPGTLVVPAPADLRPGAHQAMTWRAMPVRWVGICPAHCGLVNRG
jgi:hypothetical protein